VLVRICRGWDEACVQAQLPFRDALAFASEEMRSRRKDVVDRYQRGDLDSDAYYVELSRAVDELYTSAEVEQIHAAWTLKEYPGALSLIQELNRLPEVTTACLSNTNAVHWRRLAGEDGLTEYPAVLALRHRLASHLLRCSKPDASIYERARATFFESLAGRPEDIIFFDDLPENVLAARAAGWTAFEVDPHADPPSQMRAHLVNLGLLSR
jgi:HAD superfamily hydrolase (TIGR01509 family)